VHGGVVWKNLVELLREYFEVEKRYTEELKSVTSSLGTPLLKVLIEGIAQDSLKRSLMYWALAEIARGRSLFSQKRS
jgi:hypothetical protein